MYCLSRSITVDDLQFGPGFHLMIRNSVHRVRRTTVIGDDSGTAATPLVVVSIIHPVRTDGHAATTAIGVVVVEAIVMNKKRPKVFFV